ncbi:flippase-like domain-containing protein [Candidatus Saccharibacteria bacterium]|nr:flippase-like domain-containing protein [Candidatus Saccharibacteria bacterium]
MRRYLLPIAVVATVVGVYASYDTVIAFISYIQANHLLLVAVIVAVTLQLGGQMLRVKRTKLILDQAAESSQRFQFGALSVGYLFNALLPFRIGELVRSLIVARRLHISFLYTFVSVVIERITDILLLGVLILVCVAFIGGEFIAQIVAITLGLMMISVALLAGIALLIREDRHVLAITWRITGWFNISITNRLRFKVWSLIFGLQNFTKNKRLVKRYIAFTIFSWILYIASMLVIAAAVLKNATVIEKFVASIAPYVVSIQAWGVQNIDVNSQLSLFVAGQTAGSVLEFAVLSWTILTLPMAILGLVTLFVLRSSPEKRPVSTKAGAFSNKLQRHNDISQEFPGFLDSYFSGNQMARVLHRLEASGDLRLVKYFKGGSDAITVLVLDGDDLFVKKIIPKEYKDRLKAQYDWLKDNQKMQNLVKIKGQKDMQDFYSIDLEYDPKYIPYFEYLHSSSRSQSEEVLATVWKNMYDKLHKNAKVARYQPKHRDKFINKHIWNCVELAAESHDDIREVLKRDTILINGVKYDNLPVIMKKIQTNKQAWHDIATYRESGIVHGDPSIDNILVSPEDGQPLIIDPAPDGNIINGPVFDMGKLLQSFYCGYEFLFRDEDPIELGVDGSINYRDQRSERYLELYVYVRDGLAGEYLTVEERRSLLFHAGTLLIRRLKHQVHSYPQNSLKMYAVGVKTLNDFLAQYDTK